MRQFDPFQIKIYLIDIINETVYLIQINIYVINGILSADNILDGASVVLSWKSCEKSVKM